LHREEGCTRRIRIIFALIEIEKTEVEAVGNEARELRAEIVEAEIPLP